MAISFEKIKPGTRLLDIHKERKGNTTISELSCFPVDIVSVDSASRTAMVRWNGNPEAADQRWRGGLVVGSAHLRRAASTLSRTLRSLSSSARMSADEEVMSDKKTCCNCKLPLPAHFTYTNTFGAPQHETTYACCQALKKALDAERERNALLRSDLLQLLAKHGGGP